MNLLTKYFLIISLSFASGYLFNKIYQTNTVEIQNTKTGMFVISKNHIYELVELSTDRDVIPFEESFGKMK